MKTYDLDETACLTVKIRSAGTLVDPATLAVTITKPDDTQLSYTEADSEIERESAGVFMVHPNCDVPGVWSWKAVATEPNLSEQSEFYVRTDLEDE